MKRVFTHIAAFVALSLISTCISQEILELSGIVEIRDSVDAAWRPADSNEILTEGSMLRTFQGSVDLDVSGNLLKMDAQTEIETLAAGFKLVQGSVYVKNAEDADLTFRMPDPIKISGEARLDLIEAGLRLAVLSGEAQAVLGGRVSLLAATQQIILADDIEPTVSPFIENDPWYRSFTVIGEGAGTVIGLSGVAEVLEAETWQAASTGDAFLPGVSARTGAESWLEIKFDDDNIVRLQENSEIALLTLEDLAEGFRRTVLELREGKIWAIVESEGQPFEIETPGLVAGVRGTKFRLDASTDKTPPLIKTFEGSVAGISGFTETVIEEGQQFDLEAGVAELVLDETDSFNLSRDRLVIPPGLTLDPFPSRTTNSRFELTGATDPGTTVSLKSSSLVTEQGAFAFDTDLSSGLNVFTISANVAEGATARKTAVIIKEGRNVFVDARFEQTSEGIELIGVASAGANIIVRGSFGQLETTADTENRFRLSLPLVSEVILLEAFLSQSEFTSKEIQLNP